MSTRSIHGGRRPSWTDGMSVAALVMAALLAGLPAFGAAEEPASPARLQTELERCLAASADGDAEVAAAAAAAAEEEGERLSGGPDAPPGERALVSLLLGRVALECRIPAADFMARGALAADAERHFRSAIELDPQLHEARFLLGALLYHLPPFLGRTADAVAVLEEHLRRTGGDAQPLAWVYLGDLHERLGDPAAARATWRAGTERHPDDPTLAERLAQVPAAPAPAAPEPVEPAASSAPEPPGDDGPATLSRWLDAEVAGPMRVGMTVGIARGGAPTYLAGHGLAELEHGVPAAPETVYRIGSVTKTFTAALVLRLAEEGLLGLDDPLSSWLPEAAAAPPSPTLEQLLGHTGGLPRDVAEGADGSWVSRSLGLPRVAAPGERHHYSNLGYALLGRVIEAAVGEPWEEALRGRILAPLGLAATGPCREDEIVAHRAQGYQWLGDRFVHDVPVALEGFTAPAGGLCSTAGDLLVWLAALRDGRALDAASWRRMVTPATVRDPAGTTYALGLRVREQAGRRVVQHGGGINGFFSEIAHFPAAGPHEALDVVVLTNCETSDPRDLVATIAERLLAGARTGG